MRLGDIAQTTSGSTPRRDKPHYYGGTIPWVKSGELGDRVVYETSENLSDEGLASSNAKVFPKGTLCIALYGATVGKLGILGIDAATNQAICAVFPPAGLDTRYLYRFFEGKRRELIEQGKGGAQSNISQGIIRDTLLPVPPLPEQRRIVGEIEKQFTRLEAGVAALRRVQANLKRYRAAVLKAACEGKLVPTEAELVGRVPSRGIRMKTKNAASGDAAYSNAAFVSGEQLLQRILTERRKNWRGRGKYKEPASPDTPNLLSLPKGWTWASADQISSQITDGEHIQPRYSAEGYPMLSAKHVRSGFVIFTDFPLISEKDFQLCLKRCAPTRDDILIVCVGATTGRAAIVGEVKPFAVVRSVLLIRPLIQPRFMLAWVQSPWCQTWIQRASGSSAQAHFYINNAKNMCVPLPPLAEQTRIVAEVERRLSVVEELEGGVSANLQRATRLRQSILQKAFTGNL